MSYCLSDRTQFVLSDGVKLPLTKGKGVDFGTCPFYYLYNNVGLSAKSCNIQLYADFLNIFVNLFN